MTSQANDPYLPADWPAPANVHAFTTLRLGAGVSPPPFDRFNLGNCLADGGDDPRFVMRNRDELVERCALPAQPRWLRQVHGADVVHVGDGPHPGPAASTSTAALPPPRAGEGRGGGGPASREPEADAAVTGVAGVVLAVLTADCLPVVFAADDGREVAVAHAGWRGLAAGVLENTVAAMQAPGERLVAWLGPAAGPSAYEVGGDVHAAFVDRDPRAATAFSATRPGHWLVDLYALARQRLALAGVARVHGGGLCTISDPARFYSHRRDRRTGRMATVAWFDAAD